MSDVNANIIVDIKSSGALADLKRLEQQINQFQRSVISSNSTAANSQNALNRAMLDGINHTGMFNAKFVEAHDSISRFSDQIDRGKLSLGQYTRLTASQLPGMSRVFRREFDTIQQVAESRVKRINTQYLALGKTIDGVTKSIAATPTTLGKGYATDIAVAAQRQQLFNKMIDDGSTKLLNWGKNTQWAGRQLMVGFTIPFAALGAVSAKTFMEIDKATVALRRVYGDLNTTTKEVDSNIAAIKSLGAEYTKYGISLQETINIGARAAATGATNEKLVAATEQTMRLATLGQIDYNQALDATISLQSAFGISNKNLGETIDYLNAVENQTILTLDDMTLAVPRVATVIKGLGGDVKDLAVFMTAMREGGVSAENAANALKSGLASLINPTKAAKETLGGLGINIDAIVKTNKGDLMGTIQAFGQALNSLSAFERQQALEKTFGKYQYARMGALFSNITKNSSQAARAMDIAKMSAQELAAVSNKELNVVSESTSVKFQAAMEKLKIAIAPLGEAFLKGITPIVNLVTKVADAFNNLPDGVKNSIAVITAAVAGLGPVLLMTIGLIGNGFANIVKGIQFFRKTLAGIKGDASAFNYMATAELDALAATNALEGATGNLTGKLNLQRSAVAALTAEYERFAAVAGIAGASMRGSGAPGAGGRGQGGMRAPIRRATGGTIPGTGNTDTVPAMLTPGEFVINKKATAENLPLLQAINDGQVQGYQFGGIAKALTRFANRRTQFAHATESRIIHGDEALSLLRPAEQQFYKQSPQSVRASALSRLTLGVSDLENQALRTAVGNGLNPKVFSRRIADTKLTPRLFERISLPKGTKVRFREILAEEVEKIKKDPMFDDDFAKAFNSAEKRMAKELKSNSKLQEQFVSTISSARQDAFTRIKFSLPEGSSIAANVDEARRIATERGLPVDGQPFFYYHSKQRKASALVRMPDGRIVGVQTDSTRSIPKMNNGGQILGGQVTQSRPFYGAFNAKTIEMFKNWIGTHSESIPALRKTILKDPKMKSMFGAGFSRSTEPETLLRSQFMSSIPEVGSELSLGALRSFSAEGTDVVRHLADSKIRKQFEKASYELTTDKKLQERSQDTLRKAEAGLLPPYAPEHKYRSPIGGRVGLDAWIEDTKMFMGPTNENIKRNEEIVKKYNELHPTVIRLKTPSGTVRANLDDIVPAMEQQYGSMGASYQVQERERILHNAKIKITGQSTDKNGIVTLDAELIKSVGLNKGGMLFASNGTTVPGVGNTDTVPAMLTPGEFVINKQATAENLPLLHAINDGNVSQSALGFNKGGQINGIKYAPPGGQVSSNRFGYGIPSEFLASILKRGVSHQGNLENASGLLRATPISQRIEKINSYPKKLAWGPAMYTSPSAEESGIYRFIYNRIMNVDPKNLNMYKLNWNSKLVEMAKEGKLKFYDHSNPAHRRKLAQQLGFSVSDKPQKGIPYFTKTTAPDPADTALHAAIQNGALIDLGYDAAYFPMANKSQVYRRHVSEGSHPLESWKGASTSAYRDLFGGRSDLGEFTILSDRLTPKVSRGGGDQAESVYQRIGQSLSQSFFSMSRKDQMQLIKERFKGRLSTRFNFTEKDLENPASQSSLESLHRDYRLRKNKKMNQGGKIPLRFSNGNIVPGIGNTDTVPAMLTPGEFVVNKQSTAENLSVLRAINNGVIKGYAAGDIVQSSVVGYKAPQQIASQTRQMDWATRARENESAQAIARKWKVSVDQLTSALSKVAAHIVPDTGQTKTWRPRNLIADTQAVNEMMNRTQTITPKILENTKYLERISKSTGLSLGRVRKELENFAKGQHPITEKSAKVLKRVASMDEAASRMALSQARPEQRIVRNEFGANARTGYISGMTKGILGERLGTGFYTNRPRYTGPTIQTQRPRAASRRGTVLPETLREPVPSHGMIPMIMGSSGGSGAYERQSYSRTALSAKEIMKEQGLSGAEGRKQAIAIAKQRESEIVAQQERRNAIRQKVSGKMMGAGMGIGMASMIPFMMQDQQGQFMGMNANALGIGMTVAGMATPMLGGLVGKIAAGGAGAGGAGGLGAAMGGIGAVASNPITLGIAAAALLVSTGLILWRKNIDENAKETANLTANLGVTANSVSEMGKILGKSTPQQRQTMQQLGLTKQQQQIAQETVVPQLQSEGGQKFLTELKAMNAPQQQQKLQDYLNAAVATKMMNKDEASVFAKAVGAELGNVMMGITVANRTQFQQQGSRGMLDIAQQRMSALESNTLVKEAMAASGATDSMTSAAAAAAVGGSMQVFSDLADTVALANEEYNSGQISLEKYNKIINESTIAQAKYKDLYVKANTGSMEQGGTRQAIAGQLVASGKMTQEQYDTYAHGLDIGRASVFGLDTAFVSQSIASQAAQDPRLAAAMKGTGKRGGRIGRYQTEEDKKLIEEARARAEKTQSNYVEAVDNGMQAQFDLAIMSNEMTVEQAMNFQQYLVSGTKNAADAVETIRLTGDVALANFQAAAKEQGKSLDYIYAGARFKKFGGSLGDYQAFIASFGEDVQDTMVNFFKGVNIDLQKQMVKQQKQLSAIMGQENTAKVLASVTYQKALKEGKAGVFTSEAKKAEKAGVGQAYGTITAAITSTDNGEPMDSKEFVKRSKQTLKALKDFEKGGKEVKKRAVISLLTQVEGADGKQITQEQAKAAYDDLIKEYGEKKILNLPTDVITKVTVLQDQIIGIDEAISNVDKLINAAAAGQEGVATGVIKGLMARRSALLALKGSVSSQIADLVSGAGTGNLPLPPTTGGGGGGGGKSFMQSLLEQIQMYVDATATMKDLNNAKKDFIAETLKGKGIMDKLMGAGALGLNPQLMEYVMGLGPEGAKKWMAKNTRVTKGGKTVLNKRGQNVSDKVLQAGIGQTMDESQYASQNIGMQMRAARTLNRFGVRPEVMDRIAGDSTQAAKFLKIQRDVDAGRKGAIKEMMKFIQLQETQVQKEKDLADVMDPIGAKIRNMNTAHDLYTKAIEDMKRPLQDQIDLYNKQLDQLQRLNAADQHRIDGLERQKEIIQRQIDGLQRQNEMQQRAADALRREDEIRNRTADALSHDLEMLSQQEQLVRDGYQKRIDALNKVSEINQHIIEQQRQQVGLSQALSQGDIYAAARQVIEARQSNAAFAAQQQQNALQTGMENAVGGLRTAGGLTREQAEKQIANIKEQSYQTGLKIRDIEDSIYNTNLEITKLKDAQYAIDLDQILPIREAIYERDQLIYQLQVDKIQPLQDEIDKIDEMKKKEDQKFEDQIVSLEAQQLAKELTDSQAKSVNNLAQQYKGVADIVAEINRLIASGDINSKATVPGMQVGESPQDYAARLAAFKELQKERQKAAIEAEKEKKAKEEAASKTKGKFAGGILHAIAGMMVPGVGGMDSVPIMAAPGEFIMRKASVDKYGAAMMQAMNMGAYQVPRYNVPVANGTSVRPASKNIQVKNAPVYNGYSVNVNVAGTNASADDIANRTIARMKEMQNVNIRSARG